MLDEALKYLDRNWCIIPCKLTKNDTGKVNKRPLVAWTRFQEELPTKDEVRGWWKKWPDAHVGLVTGSISGIFVVDLDIGYDEAEFKKLKIPKTLKSKTPSGGCHLFLRHPHGEKIKTVAGFRKKIDIRGDGGFVVVAPSTYPDGRKYEWKNDRRIAKAPDALVKLLKEPEEGEYKPKDLTPVIKGTSEGGRNAAAASLVGFLVHHIPPSRWKSIVWPLVQSWNTCNNKPPLSETELWGVFKSIGNARYRELKPKRK